MIIRKGQPTVERQEDAAKATFHETAHYSTAGGLTQFGAYVETLQPGAVSSNRHWHENEDEFLYVLSGELTVIENDGAHTLHPGDSACWPAGVPDAHHVSNQTGEPCAYVIVGTRAERDVCHYPDLNRTLYVEGKEWRMEDVNGDTIRSGTF